MKKLYSIIQSQTPPQVTNVLWVKGDEIYVHNKGGWKILNPLSIIKDAEIVLIPEGQENAGDDALELKWNLADGTEKSTYINLTDFLRESEFQDGLSIENGKVKILVDEDSEEYLTVGETGIKVSGINEAILSKVNSLNASLTPRISYLEDQLPKVSSLLQLAINTHRIVMSPYHFRGAWGGNFEDKGKFTGTVKSLAVSMPLGRIHIDTGCNKMAPLYDGYSSWDAANGVPSSEVLSPLGLASPTKPIVFIHYEKTASVPKLYVLISAGEYVYDILGRPDGKEASDVFTILKSLDQSEQIATLNTLLEALLSTVLYNTEAIEALIEHVKNLELNREIFIVPRIEIYEGEDYTTDNNPDLIVLDDEELTIQAVVYNTRTGSVWGIVDFDNNQFNVKKIKTITKKWKAGIKLGSLDYWSYARDLYFPSSLEICHTRMSEGHLKLRPGIYITTASLQRNAINPEAQPSKFYIYIVYPSDGPKRSILHNIDGTEVTKNNNPEVKDFFAKINTNTSSIASLQESSTALADKVNLLASKDELDAISTRLNAIIGTEDATNKIDTFNEIVSFLNNILNTDTLEGIVGGIGLSISNIELHVDDITINSGITIIPRIVFSNTDYTLGDAEVNNIGTGLSASTPPNLITDELGPIQAIGYNPTTGHIWGISRTGTTPQTLLWVIRKSWSAGINDTKIMPDYFKGGDRYFPSSELIAVSEGSDKTFKKGIYITSTTNHASSMPEDLITPVFRIFEAYSYPYGLSNKDCKLYNLDGTIATLDNLPTISAILKRTITNANPTFSSDFAEVDGKLTINKELLTLSDEFPNFTETHEVSKDVAELLPQPGDSYELALSKTAGIVGTTCSELFEKNGIVIPILDLSSVFSEFESKSLFNAELQELDIESIDSFISFNTLYCGNEGYPDKIYTQYDEDNQKHVIGRLVYKYVDSGLQYYGIECGQTLYKIIYNQSAHTIRIDKEDTTAYVNSIVAPEIIHNFLGYNKYSMYPNSFDADTYMMEETVSPNDNGYDELKAFVDNLIDIELANRGSKFTPIYIWGRRDRWNMRGYVSRLCKIPSSNPATITINCGCVILTIYNNPSKIVMTAVNVLDMLWYLKNTKLLEERKHTFDLIDLYKHMYDGSDNDGYIFKYIGQYRTQTSFIEPIANCNGSIGVNPSKVTDVLWMTPHKTDFSYAFYGLSSVTRFLVLVHYPMDNVTDMQFCFCGCSSLDYHSFPYPMRYVTNLSHCFSQCSSLTLVDGLHNVITSATTNLAGMFEDCTSLERIRLSGCNTIGVTRMSGMFSGCTNLRYINLDSLFFNTSLAIPFDCPNLGFNEDGTSNGWIEYMCREVPQVPEGTTKVIILHSNLKNSELTSILEAIAYLEYRGYTIG